MRTLAGRPLVSTALVACVLLAAAGPGPAQVPERPDPDFSGAARDLSEDQSLFRSFAVPENRTASDVYDESLRYLAEKRYASALPGLQRLLDAYSNRVVRVPLPDVDEQLYHGLGREVASILRDLGPEARRVYRELYDGEAARLLSRALEHKSVESLLEVVRRFRYTSSGAAAVEALGDLCLESGDVLGAAHFYGELAAAADPEDQARLEPIKLIHALARAGRYEEAVAAGRRLVARRNRPTVVLNGKEAAVDALVRDWSRAIVAPPREDWPCFGGDATHTRLMPALRTVSRLEWQATLNVLYEVDRELSFGEMPAPFQPVVGRGKVYVHNGLRVWAFNLSDGLERWTFSGAVKHSTDRPNSRLVFSGVLSGNRFIANLEVPVDTPEHYYQTIPIQKKIPARKLFAFDSDTGDLLWSHEAGHIAQAMNRADREFVSRVNIPSPPVVRDETLYCGASYFEGKIYCYLTALDVRTGHLRWHTLICTGQETLNMFGRPVEEPVLGVPAVADGVVYFATNLGVVAAVDAQLGKILWLTTYAQVSRPRRVMVAEPLPTTGWQLCPVLVKDGVVVAAPTDGRHLLGIDAASGRIRWTVEREGAIALRHLLGVRDGVVFASGNGLAAFDLQTGREKWPAVRFPAQEQTSWRGAVTAEGVLVPTMKRLRLHDPRTGTLIVDPPVLWESPNDQAGNLVAASEDVIVTASRLLGTRTAYVSVFYDRRERIRRLEQLVRTHPDDPGVRIDLARTLAQAGLTEEARRAFERAVETAGRLGDARGRRLLGEAVRGRFDVLVRLARDAIAQERLEAAARFVGRARAAARGQPFQLDAMLLEESLLRRQSDVQGLARLYVEMKRTAGDRRRAFRDWGDLPVGLYARLQAAEVYRAMGRPARAVDEYQEIILAYPDTVLPATRGPARDHAVDLIRDLIDRHGRAVYARHDEAAEALYRQGQDNDEPERFLQVVLSRPNARIADRCRLAYADAARRRGAAVQALRVLREFFRTPAAEARGATTGDRRSLEARALISLLESYRDLGFVETARQLVDRLVADYGDTVLEAADRRTTARAWAEANRPAADAPPPPPEVEPGPPVQLWSRPIPPEEHVEVLEQTGPVRERSLLLVALIRRETQESRLLAFSTSVPPRELWEAPLPEPPSRAELRPATVIDGRVVLALDHHVLALDASSGALRWRRDLDGRRLGGVAVREGLVVAVSVREPDPSGLEARRVPVLEAFDLAGGASVWQQPLQGDHPLPPVAAGRRAIVTTRKNPAEIVAVDLLTGHPAGRLRVSERYLACDPAILAGRRMLLSPDSRSELWLVDLDRLEASWQDSLVSTEVDALRPGAGGFLVSGLAVRRQNADDAGANLAIRQRLVLVDPDRPGIAWQAELDPGATLDAAYVLPDGDGWLFPVRNRNGGVELTSLDARGRRRHRPIPLFEPRVFQTPLYSVFGGVLALGFDPTAHERRNQPTAHFVLIDADRGQVVKRWSASEPAPPRGRGIWPTRTGFFVAWPDRIEFYDLGTQNAR